MADVLSQSEIDALLSALNSGELDVQEMKEEVEADKVREYDFRTANRFSKEQIRTLHIIYENFGRIFSTYLSGTLRSICDCEVVSVEELKYQEFVNSLPSPVMLAIIAMRPLEGQTLIEISPDVAYAMISRLLGGTPSGADEQSGRGFTEIEIVLIERMIRQFIPGISESWNKVIDMDTVLERMETSSQFAQIVALNETVAIITLNVKIGESEGLMNICIPHVAIEPVSKQLNTRSWFQGATETRRREPVTDKIRQNIQNTPLPVTAVFKDTTAAFRDIVNLQVGDVIQLDHKVKESLVLKVGHLSKFRAALGEKDNKYAVKIVDFIREEELSDE